MTQHLDNFLIMKISPIFIFLLLLTLYTTHANAQNFPDGRGAGAGIPSPDSVSNFQPSLAVVIGMLAIMFFLTFLLLLYAKFCHRPASPLPVRGRRNIRDGLVRSSSSLTSGLDKTVVQSLPFFRFCSLRGSREGLECSVCLSKFEDVEILRLLPKCKHAFHMDCIDQWLDKHATCPLCRRRVSAEDVSQCSSSLRFLWNPEAGEESSGTVELFVQREDNNRTSSRFSVGSSFRKIVEEKNDEELPIREETETGMDSDDDDNGTMKNIASNSLHKFNHRIVVSDVVFKNRWSNVSSSDLVFLNSEMINDVSSARFDSSSLDSGNLDHEQKLKKIDDRQIMNIKEEMERKRVFENKVREIRAAAVDDHRNVSNDSGSRFGSMKGLSPNEKRSMSEIVVHPRFADRESSVAELGDVREERRRRIWMPIARKTVRWFANRERRQLAESHQGLNLQRLNNV